MESFGEILNMMKEADDYYLQRRRSKVGDEIRQDEMEWLLEAGGVLLDDEGLCWCYGKICGGVVMPDCVADCHQWVNYYNVHKNGKKVRMAMCYHCLERTLQLRGRCSCLDGLVGELPILNDKTDTTPCERCGDTQGVESHHWAPRAVFGYGAEEWPKSDLCPTCHSHWHSMMNGYKWGLGV